MANLINTIRGMNQVLEETLNEEMNIKKLEILARLGLVDNLPLFKRALAKMEAEKLLSPEERNVIFTAFGKFSDVITNDPTVFQKARKAVKEEMELDEMAPEVGPPEPVGSGKKVNPKDVRWDVDKTIPKTYDKLKKEEVEIEIDVNDELWEQFVGELNEEGIQLDELDWQGIKDRYSKFYGGLGDKIANSKPVSAVSNVASKIKDRYSKFYGGIGDKSISDTLPKTTSQLKAVGKFASSAADAAGDAVSKAVDVVKPYANKGFDKLKAYVNKPRPKEPTKPQPSEPSSANSAQDLETKKKFAGAKADWTGPGKGVASKTDTLSKPDWKGPGRGVAEEVELDEASPMIKPPKNEFAKKADAFAHAKKNGGKVMKKTFTHPTSGQQHVSYVVKEEVELDEARVTKDNVAKLLVKYGNNPKTVKQMVDKEFDRAVKAHPTATAAKIADVIRVTAESVELDEAAMVSTDALNRAVTAKFSPKVSAQVMGYLKPGTKKQVSVKDASAAMTKMNMSPRQIANVMSAMNEEVEIDEAGEVKTRNKMKKNRMDTARGDLYNKRNKLNIGPGDTGHATRQQSMKALGRALRNEEEEIELDEAPLVLRGRSDANQTMMKMMQDYINKANDSDLQKLGKIIGKKITIQGKKVVIEGVEINLDEEINMTIKTVEEAKRYGLTQSLLDAVKGVLKGDEQQDDGEGLDKVDPKQAKGKFADRKDKDINNDGKSDSTDKYLHARRKAVTKAVEKDDKAQTEKKNEAKSAKDVAKGKGTAKQEPVEVNPQMEAAGCKTMKEAEMTDAQMKKREEIVKSMKKSKGDFEKRYGDRAKDVMYATATKMAMKEGFEFESAEAFFEAADIPFDGPYKKVKRNVKDKSGAVHTPMSRAKDLAKKAMKKEEEVEEAYKVPKNYAAMMLKKRKKANDEAQKDLKDPSHNPSWANSKSK